MSGALPYFAGMLRYALHQKVFLVRVSLSLLFALLITPSANADSLVSAAMKGLRIDLKVEGGGERTRLVISDSNWSEISILNIENPSRIVIDLVGAKTQPYRSFRLDGRHPLITSLRIGTHPDKVRIVLDLSVNYFPRYAVTENPGVLELAVDHDEPQHEEQPKSPSPSLTPFPSPTPSPKKMKEVKVIAAREVRRETPTPSPTDLPTSAPTPLPVESPQPSPTASPPPIVSSPTPPKPASGDLSSKISEIRSNVRHHLTAIDFEEDGKIPMVAIRLSSRPLFSMVKRSETEYAISIPDCALADSHLSLEQFPPANFIGFTYIWAKEEKQGGDPVVSISIGVESGTQIVSSVRENSILIRRFGPPRS